MIALIACNNMSASFAHKLDEAFNQREEYKDKTGLGNPDDANGCIDRSADSSHLQQLNDASLVGQGGDIMRNSDFGQLLQDSDATKIDAMNEHQINQDNKMFKDSLAVEENPMSNIGDKGFSSSETTIRTEVKKTCTEGVEFNIDVGLELILDVEEQEYSIKRDKEKIYFPMREVHSFFLHDQWGRDTLWGSNPVPQLIESQLNAKSTNYKSKVTLLEYQAIRWACLGVGARGLGYTLDDNARIGKGDHGVHHFNGTWCNGKVGFHAPTRCHRNPDIPIRFWYRAEEFHRKLIEKNEYWQVVTEGAEKLAESNECYETGRVCLKNGVKSFLGKYDITRPCWHEKITYRCSSEPKDGCLHLIKQDCRLDDSTCEYKIGNICLRWKRDYICSKTKKKMNYSLADSPIYCLGGDCHSPLIEKNQDFSNVGYLAVLNEAKNDCVKDSTGICKNPITVFPGHVSGCKKKIAGFMNCCASMKGWGKSINMTRCSGEEKGLALKREKGLCHNIGTYCHQKAPVTKTCLVKKTNFCCFSSKLARIFHEQGRQQLGIHWGDAESPNCRALTLEELTRLDFSKFDMEELFDDMLSKGKSNMNKSFLNTIPTGMPAMQKEQMKDNNQKNQEY